MFEYLKSLTEVNVHYWFIILELISGNPYIVLAIWRPTLHNFFYLELNA